MSVFVNDNTTIEKLDRRFVKAVSKKGHSDLVLLALTAAEWRSIVRMAKIGWKSQQFNRYLGGGLHPDHAIKTDKVPKKHRPIHRKILTKPRKQ